MKREKNNPLNRHPKQMKKKEKEKKLKMIKDYWKEKILD